MAIIRAQAVLKHTSGLAKDNVVNTFHFAGDAADAPAMAALAQDVQDLYAVDKTGGASPTITYLLGHSVTTVDVHLYVMPGVIDASTGREAPAGPPVYSLLGAANLLADVPKASPTDLPQEVAVCLSYQATPGAGLVQRRRRGRVFFGPLNASAGTQTPAGLRPSTGSAGIRTAIEGQFQKLLQDTDPNYEFVVYSRPYAGRAAIERPGKSTLPAIPARTGVTIGVDQLWIDDEFDTQRRRGLQRTGRTLITAAG